MSQAAAQYENFIKEILECKKVWTVKDEKGFPSSTNPNGETAIPFWSKKSRAEKTVESVPAYEHFLTFEITLEKFLASWLTGLEEDGLYVGVNWSGKKATGYDINPKDLIERIKYEQENSNIAKT